MQIGIFTDTFYPEINGVATSCLMLYKELKKRGHEVHVFAPRCNGWEEYQEEDIHYLPSAPFVALKDRNVALPTIGSIINMHRLKFDVVHTNSEFVMGYFGRYVAKTSKCAFVHTYHTVWEDYTYYLTRGHIDDVAKGMARKYSEWWCNRFDRVITPTGKTKNLLRSYGVETEIDIIPSGMDIARFSPALHSEEERNRIRIECGVQPGERVLLNIGRIAKEKNLDQVLRVFAKLYKDHPDIRFVLIGEGPQREELEKTAEKLGVSRAVTMTGPKPWEKIDQYYAIGDVFCSASHSETQGLTYIEAMASGLCVCAVNDSCLDGVILDGISGILSDDSDESLYIALLRAFGKEGEHISRHAAEYAAPYDVEHFAQKVEECYRKAICEHNEKASEEG